MSSFRLKAFQQCPQLSRRMALGGVVLTSVLLSAIVFLLYREQQWLHPQDLTPEAAFARGTIGTELIPLPVLQVLPELVHDRGHFTPLGPDAGDWIEQFGFLRHDDPQLAGLPRGFTLSNYRPRSGAPSPVQFVGIGCATCHSDEIRLPDGSSTLVVGAGNMSLNLFGWLDALQAALLDKKEGHPIVTVQAVSAAYRQRYGKALSFEERMMIRLWLQEFRSTLESNLPRFDEPHGRGKSLSEKVTPTGPGRTLPFRTLVRTILNRPGHDMAVYTKISAVFEQDRQEWAQVDGGIRGLNARSALAVLAAGATLQNMEVAEIRRNVIGATDFVRKLKGPRYAEVFPREPINTELAAQGKLVYLAQCDLCHGHPEAHDRWVMGTRTGHIVPVEEIKTDAERVTFRHLDELPGRLFDHFPERHPFKFARRDIRTTGGYLNEPLESAFARAPYLHNASVPTLAELINLKPRRPAFFRGRNDYDPRDVGLVVPRERGLAHHFRFDTTAPGNSNQGHDYPWAYRGPGWNEKDLQALLEYLKTL